MRYISGLADRSDVRHHTLMLDRSLSLAQKIKTKTSMSAAPHMRVSMLASKTDGGVD
jgi:hypothetical protein